MIVSRPRPVGPRRTTLSRALLTVLAASSATVGIACSRAPTTSPPATVAMESRTETFGGVPVAFERNVGQTDDEVAFFARGGSSTVFLTKRNETVFVMAKHGTPTPKSASATASPRTRANAKAKGTPPKEKQATTAEESATVRMTLVNASTVADVVGESELSGHANYLVGNEPSRHRKDVPRFEKVRSRGVYPGIDVVYYGGKDHALEYDFIVKKGADPRVIAMSFEGADRVAKNAAGQLAITVGTETVVLKAPVSHQTIAGVRRDVESRYELHGNTVTIALGAYDPEHELVIDPLINFSSYLGGSGAERVTCLARDGAGNLYLSGSTASANYPLRGALPGQSAVRGGRDAFVTKLDPAGSQVLYSTYLGGTGEEAMTDLFGGFETGAMRTCAVDAQGRAYVSTTTSSSDFPTTVGAFDTSLDGGLDVTLSRLNAAGNALEFSTYLGGTSSEYWAVIALDPSGHIWVSGQTASTNFPTKSPTQATRGGVGDDADMFLTRVTPDGAAITFSTYFGGPNSEYPFDIAVDGSGNPVVVGASSSLNLPTTAGVIQPAYGGGDTGGQPQGDGFIAKYNLAANGTATLGLATYLGGSDFEIAQAVALGGDGSIYVGGVTISTNFPGQVGRPGSASSEFDGFVVKLNATATTRVYSKLFGQDGRDGVYDIAVNAAGNLFVAGTGTLGNTTVNGCGRPGDKGILGMLKTDGTGWEYLTPFGEVNSQILVDSADTVYVAGWGASGSVPIVGSVAQATYGGGTSDAYLLKLAKLPNATATGCAPCTGDFGGAGPNACPSSSPKCLISGECVATGACDVDADCGGKTSGRVCDAKLCKDGCRGTGGNGCTTGLVCSSATSAVGTCGAPPPDAGPPVDAGKDSAVPPVADAAVPSPAKDASVPVPAPSSTFPRNDEGSLEGGGMGCATSGSEGPSGGAPIGMAGMTLLGLALVARSRRKSA